MQNCEVIDHLMETDKNFRHLREEHQKYDAELNKISRLSFPTGEQKQREIDLKKKKLLLKDKMEKTIKACRSQ
ncbi:MAG: dihydroxy-acid dehydratase [bacterium]